jgi:uncharacterized membrane protein
VLSIRAGNTRVLYRPGGIKTEVRKKQNMSSSLSDAKVLGGIGSVLVLFTAVPNVGWLLGIAGLVMTLLAIKNVSRAINEKGIYSNMLNAVILAIGAIGVGTVTLVGAFYRVLGMGSFVGTKFVLAPSIPVGDWIGLAIAVVGGLLAVWAILVTSAVFLRRSYNLMASRLNVKMFGTAGLLYLIGAATAVIGVGFLLIFVAEILLAVSFFSIQEQQRVPEATQTQTISAKS